MNEGAIAYTIIILLCYLALTAIMPAVFLYRYLKEKPFMVRFALYQVTGNLYITFWGFVFSFLNIWRGYLAVLVLIVLPLLAKLFIFRRDLIRFFINYLKDRRAKVVTSRGTLRAVKEWILGKCRRAFELYIKKHYLEIAFLLALAVFAVWYYGYFKFYNFTYASSDEATHLYWINSLFAGDSFPVGMYPHSMHFIIAAIHSVSGMQTLIINHYFSVTIMLMVHFMIYCAARSLYSCAAGAVCSAGFFLLSGMFVTQRYHNTLPMEFGFIAMLAMIILLNEFVKSREKLFMWMAALATGWTFHTHFYVTILCVFLWIGFILVYFKTIIRFKLFRKTVLIALIAAAAAVLPFGIGLASGQKFEQSIDWALGVMGVEQSSDIETVDEYPPEISAQVSSGTGAESETSQASEPAEEPVKLITIQQAEFMIAKTPADYLKAAEHLLTARLINNDTSALIVYILLIFAFLYGFGKIIISNITFRKRKKEILASGKSPKEYRRMKQEFIVRKGLPLAVPFMIAFGLFCCLMSYFGLPEIIDSSRAAMILAPVLALIFAAPAACIQDIAGLIPVENRRAAEMAVLILAGGALGAFFAKGNIKQLDAVSCYAVTQELSNELTYDLIATHEKSTWTVISPVNDLLGIRHYGYHYEVIDLLMDIENGKENIFMPTDELYVVVEKKCMNAAGVFYLPDYHADLAAQSEELDESLIDVNFYDTGLPWMDAEQAYSSFRLITMSKLYAWMEEMKKFYPNEVEIYAEDDLCVVYRLLQNADFPLNLSRDYRVENRGVSAREDFERRYERLSENSFAQSPVPTFAEIPSASVNDAPTSPPSADEISPETGNQILRKAVFVQSLAAEKRA